MKKATLILLISAACLILASFIVVLSVLSTAKVQGGFNLKEPDRILFYHQSLTPTTLEKGSDKYAEFMKEWENAGQSTKLAQIFGKFKLTGKVEQSTDTSLSWRAVEMKEEREDVVAVEIIWNSMQSTIAWQGNNSKKIDFGSILFVVTNSNKFQLVNVFFRNVLNTSTNPAKNPLQIQLKTDGLFNFFIDNIAIEF